MRGHSIHQADALFAAADRDMDMHTANRRATGDSLIVVDDRPVAIGIGMALVIPAGKWMRGRGDQAHVEALRDLRQRRTQPAQLTARFADIGADGRADFDLTLQELWAHLLTEN